MDFPVGDFFFHYTTREAAFGHIVPDRTLRFSSLNTMRDPLENKPWLIPSSYFVPEGETEREQRDAIGDTLLFSRLANAIKDQARLLALTVDAAGYEGTAEAFGRGWSRARMWENYAENHEGVCLVFDRAELTESILESLPHQGVALPYHQDVEYTQTGSSGLTLDAEAIRNQVSPEFVAQYIEDHHVDLFFRKALDWATEFEYLFMVTAPVEHGPVRVATRDSLKAVVVGEKFPLWQRPAALRACEEAGALGLRLSWDMKQPHPRALTEKGTRVEQILAGLRRAEMSTMWPSRSGPEREPKTG